jgi:hypothetical protein
MPRRLRKGALSSTPPHRGIRLDMGAYDKREEPAYHYELGWGGRPEDHIAEIPEYVTISQAADILQVSETTVRKAASTGRLGAKRNSLGHWRIPARFVIPSENPYILKWWTSAHDELIVEQIQKKQWHWYWEITNQILAITPTETIEGWKAEDFRCKRWVWYNVLMYFAQARAEKLGLTKAIRKPEWKVCPLCDNRFVEDSLPVRFAELLGYDHLDFCSPCLVQAMDWTRNATSSRQEVLTFIRDLAAFVNPIGRGQFPANMYDVADLTLEERLPFLRLLMRQPSPERVKELFGSWLQVFIEAGLLEGGVWRTSRGIRCVAKDGHVCLSLGEKTIDDFLHARGIAHEKEPRYPEGNFRADFEVNGTFIEYFGLMGDTAYEAKVKKKLQLCEKHQITLIPIYPEDLVNSNTLERRLSSVLTR